MGKLTLKMGVAFFTFAVGVTSASLFVTRRYREKELVPIPGPISSPQRPTHPEGWQKIGVADKFSFYLPPDMKRMEAPGNVDYFGPHEEFANESFEVSYTYVEKRLNDELWRGKVSCEMGPRSLGGRPGYRSSEVRVGGRDAKQVVWQSERHELSFIRLCLPDIGDGTLLVFGAAAEDDRALDVAQLIFASVEFR